MRITTALMLIVALLSSETVDLDTSIESASRVSVSLIIDESET